MRVKATLKLSFCHGESCSGTEPEFYQTWRWKLLHSIQYIGFLCLNMFSHSTCWLSQIEYTYTYIYHAYACIICTHPIYFLFSIWYIHSHISVDNQQVVSPPSAPSFQAFSMQPPLSVSPRAIPGRYDTVFSDMIDANWLSYWYIIVKLQSRWHSSHVLVYISAVLS